MDYKYCLGQFYKIVSDINLTASIKLWIRLSNAVDKAMKAWNDKNDWILDPATMSIYVNQSASGLKVLIQDNLTPTIKMRCYIRMRRVSA